MSIEKLVAQFLSPLGDFEASFDDIVAAGSDAIPPLVAAIKRGRGIPQLTAALSALKLDDPVSALEPLLDGPEEVRDAGLLALGAHRDPRALPVLVKALPTARFVAAEALGDLGSADAVAPLLKLVSKYVDDDVVRLPGVNWLRSAGRCRDLRLVLTVATALAKLGQSILVDVAIHLATLRDDPKREHPDASSLRALAVRSLYYIATPGVAEALRSAAKDPDKETARAALVGMMYLGRSAEAREWLSLLLSGGIIAKHAAWCLECWAGEALPIEDDGTYAQREVDRWKAETMPLFRDGVCYRFGAPVDIERLIEDLAHDPLTLRAELKVRTGTVPLQPLLAGYPVTNGELAAVRAWWKANSSKFPAGKLHRWGRTFEPTAVDG